MMTVNEVSKLTGVSVRTLQYYGTIGLLKPNKYTESGYRLYDDSAIERLQQILLFKELEFSLKEINEIIDAPDFDQSKALENQIELLTLKKERLEKIINFARELRNGGINEMDYTVFDEKKIDEYKERAKKQWGSTDAYKEYEEKSKGWADGEEKNLASAMMKLFAEFGQMKDLDPGSAEVQAQVKKLQDYITANFYNCTNQILAGLGQMYTADGEFTENIDKAGGAGTANFAAKAIEIYCGR